MASKKWPHLHHAHSERVNAFPLRNKTRMPISPLLFSFVLELLAREIKEEKNKRHLAWKGRCKIISILRWHANTILYTENPKKSNLQKILSLASFKDERSIQKTQFYFYTLPMNNTKMKLEDNSIYNRVKNDTILIINLIQ